MARAGEVKRFLKAWMEMRQMVQAANFNRFHREGLSATQFMTLNVLPARGGMTLTELARRLNLSPATLNKTVESLETRGLVQRVRLESDARKLSITVTPEGQALQNAASGEFHTFMSGLFAGMGREARAGLLVGMEELVQQGRPPVAGAAAGVAAAKVEATRRGAGAVPGLRSSRRSRSR